MLINYNKQKMLNALTYFLNHTSLSGKKKLYKLLFTLDFEHFKQTGRSVTGLDYFAWKMGPVPTALHEAIENNDEEITSNFDIEIKIGKKGRTIYLIPKMEFEKKFFSKRELRLLQDIAERFAMASGDDMVWFTHRDTEPWYRVWEIEKRHQDKIPYEYVLDNLDESEKQTVLSIAQERQAFLDNYK